MITQNILNRYNGTVQCAVKLDAPAGASKALKLGLAVLWAHKNRANLSRADLSGADLSGAYLSRADLRGADLSGADLSRADLSGAKWRDGVIINRRPLFIGGLSWSVWVLDSHMQIGCELHKLSEWAEFDDRRICQMSGKEAVKFWRTYKDVLLAIAKSDGRE